MSLYKKISEHVIGFYLLALLLIGVGYISLLPVYEGFDETAHYSRLREASKDSSSLLNSNSSLDQFVVNYSGPVAFSSGNPPFDQGNVYKKFFNSDQNFDQYLDRYWKKTDIPVYQPSDQVNWQSQHPPLYYLLLSPLTKQSSSFIYQFFSLRLVSYLLSLIGIFFGLLAIKAVISNKSIHLNKCAFLGFLIYPLIFPMFFVEFARLGNDSLCLLLTGLLSYLLALKPDEKLSAMKIFSIGIVLGLGLLTKALFLPITFGVLLFLISKNPIFKLTLRNLLCLLLPLMAIGGAWYLFKFFAYRDLGVGVEVMQLNNGDGLLSGFLTNFSPLGLIRGMMVPLVTFSWAGTWSLVRLPEFFYIPLVFVGFWLLVIYVNDMRSKPFNHQNWLGIFLLLLIYMGLVAHVLISMALTGLGQSGGWYLHILMPWLAPIIGYSVLRVTQYNRQKYILAGLLGYAVLFHVVVFFSDLLLYAGFADKANNKHFIYSEKIYSIANYGEIFSNLNLLGFPVLGLVSLLLGFSLLVIMTMMFWKNAQLAPKGSVN